MHQKFSRFFALLFCLVLCATTVGCSQGESSGLSASSGSSAGTSTDDESSAGDTGDGKTITVWRPSNNEAIEGFWSERIASFEEEYAGQYKIEQSTFPKSGDQGYANKVSAAVLSGTLPDLILVDGPNVSNYAANEMIIPLDSYISTESKEDLLDSIVEQGTYNDQLYAVGLWESSVALFYNKKMLAEAGIAVPETMEDAWTWSELLEVAKQLTTDERYGITLTNEIGEQITYTYSPMVVENGSDLMSPDGSTATGYYNGEATVKAVETIKSFYDAGVANVSPTATEFHDGKSAMLLGGAHQIGTLDASYPDLEYGITFYPAGEDGTLKCPTGSWALSITSNCATPADAWLFLDWMTNTEGNVAGCTASGNLPSRHSSVQLLDQFQEYPRNVFVQQLESSGAPRPRTPVYTLLSNQFVTAVTDAIAGIDIQTKLDEGAQIIDNDYAMNYQ